MHRENTGDKYSKIWLLRYLALFGSSVFVPGI